MYERNIRNDFGSLSEYLFSVYHDNWWSAVRSKDMGTVELIACKNCGKMYSEKEMEEYTHEEQDGPEEHFFLCESCSTEKGLAY